MMFTIASFFNFLGPLLLGFILDNYGPRICSLVSIGFIAAGCLLFGLSDEHTLPMFIPAMCLIAFGGPGAQSAIIHLSNLFPTWKATATAIITGSFQLSFIVFLVFDQLWVYAQLSYRSLFLGYCGICAINAIVSIFLWPDEPYSYEEVVEVDHIEDPEDSLVCAMFRSTYLANVLIRLFLYIDASWSHSSTVSLYPSYRIRKDGCIKEANGSQCQTVANYNYGKRRSQLERRKFVATGKKLIFFVYILLYSKNYYIYFEILVEISGIPSTDYVFPH
jgi:MFS family permease